MASLALKSVSKIFGGRKVVDSVDLEIAAGEFIVFLGPSGCGKTTTLRMIAGFVDPSEGQVLIDGTDVTFLPPRKRGLGMVFQNYALFPTMTVAENIGFGLRQRGVDKRRTAARVEELLAMIHLEGKAKSYPDELSGGQQQRVALARALAFSPQMLLMDEPLGALDLKLREALQQELLRIQRSLSITTILVTHDQHEAMSLADRIVIMADGQVQQIGTPNELYDTPANMFVAEFMGKNNVIAGKPLSAGSGRYKLELPSGHSIDLAAVPQETTGELRLMVRPEHIEIGQDSTSCETSGIDAVVEQRRFLGNVVQYLLRLPWGQQLLAERPGSAEAIEEGASVSIHWQPQRAALFPNGVARNA